MPCRKCIQTSIKYHSFDRIGVLADGKTIYYTAPARTQEKEDSPEVVDYYIQHFEETRPNKWIWVFDCQGMKSSDLLKGCGKRIKEIVHNNCFDTLTAIYIVNPTWAIKTLTGFIKPFVLKENREKLHICSLGPIDVITRLQASGIPPAELSQIMRLIQKAPVRASS